MNLIAITASQNVGQIDWEPYIPMIFTRILRSIDLPVCYKSMKSARNQNLWSSSVASKQNYHFFIYFLLFNIFQFFICFNQYSFASLDCICVKSKKFGSTLSIEILGSHRIIFASSEQRQMG